MNKTILLAIIIMASAFICSAGDKKGNTRVQTIDTPRRLTVNDFLPIWFANPEGSKKHNHLVQAGRSDTFYYFSRASSPDKPVYTVSAADLREINFDRTDIPSIHKKFQEQIVPAKDKIRAEGRGCTGSRI